MEYSDVFISYRRKDVDFVRQLYESLKAKKLEVWIDWEDILPGSVDFTEDIQKGIEGANSFVAVLTPEYLQSEYCLNELKYAVENRKHLLPVVLRTFDDNTTPPSISHINWIYFCDHAGNIFRYDDAVDKLHLALTTDQMYIRAHTQLLIRAREWDAHGRADGFLLSGEALQEAQNFLAQSVNKEPKPTDLHAAYILASRTAEQKRIEYEQKLQRQSRTRLQLLILLLGIMLAVGALTITGLYIFARNVSIDVAKSNLTTTLKLLANGADGDELQKLATQGTANGKGTSDDPRYSKTLDWLKSVHEIDPRMYPYLYVQGKNKTVNFLADIYTVLDPSRAEAFMENYQPQPTSEIFEGFVTPTVQLNSYQDQRGRWLSGFAPIKNSNGQVVAAVGVDMLMDEVFQPVQQLGQIGQIIIVIFVAALIIGAIVYFRVRARQKAALRKEQVPTSALAN